MMDDSLSDVQQEKKMNVKELNLKTGNVEARINEVSDEVLSFGVTEDDVECVIFLDRNQAHLLMLYLQENLSPKPVSKEFWECKCGMMHPKAYVCTRIVK